MAAIVDLRSDTITKPTPEMFEAMRQAELGDDVLGDDPTVHRLEKLAAQVTGKEAAVFMPSGTMGNQAALATHVQPGDSVLFDEEAHMIWYEVAAPAVIARALSLTFRSQNGIPDIDEIERKILPRSLHTPGTTLICLENTHNRAGGAVIPLEVMETISRLSERSKARVHLDGARVFNASVALGVSVEEISSFVDSISFCLSKGLRSPVGSILCGRGEFIEEARFWRKRLGGGMRQAGILAACGIVSLTTMVDRLAEDHRRARELAVGISQIPGFRVPMESVQTNIVMVDIEGDSVHAQSRLEDKGVRCYPFGPHRLRLVTHADVDDQGVVQAIAAFQAVALQAS
ncbi:MAG: L-allo-threonine aldolase [Fimbriimonadaceae bacterium]|nr:L-allo-threonine aldolase [Fimbriimonadaceae bacterium]